MAWLNIVVKRSHIKAAEATRHEYPRSCLCPVARAVQSLGYTEARTTDTAVVLKLQGHYYPLPKSARRFIAAFDDQEVSRLKPFSFSVRIPKEEVQ